MLELLRGAIRAACSWDQPAMADDATTEPREVFFEITVVGSSAKVAAIDGTSGIEVLVLGPAHVADTDLKRLAVAKLRARLARQTNRTG
jgi:hypothetical protein